MNAECTQASDTMANPNTNMMGSRADMISSKFDEVRHVASAVAVWVGATRRLADRHHYRRCCMRCCVAVVVLCASIRWVRLAPYAAPLTMLRLVPAAHARSPLAGRAQLHLA